MQRLRALILRVAPRDIPVLITGETGVGKELVAQALHRWSSRSGSFVPVNVCAISESLFERAMFGHVRGAYSGAVESAPGVIATAHQGTLFLDEISRLRPSLQPALLRVLETKEYSRVGEEHTTRRSNFRLVSATNERLEALVEAQEFRHDLLHRLCGIELAVPPLRNRREDIPALAAHFASVQTVVDRSVHLTPDAVAALCDHDWSGNVRQLRTVIESAIAVTEDGIVDRHAIEVARPGRDTGAPLRVRTAVSRESLEEALRHANGDKAVVAREHGVHLSTVYRWMARTEVR